MSVTSTLILVQRLVELAKRTRARRHRGEHRARDLTAPCTRRITCEPVSVRGRCKGRGVSHTGRKEDCQRRGPLSVFFSNTSASHYPCTTLLNHSCASAWSSLRGVHFDHTASPSPSPSRLSF